MIKVNKEIAELRIKKDVIETEREREEVFSQYSRIIKHLFKLYELVLLEIYPMLAEKVGEDFATWTKMFGYKVVSIKKSYLIFTFDHFSNMI